MTEISKKKKDKKISLSRGCLLCVFKGQKPQRPGNKEKGIKIKISLYVHH